MPKEAAPRDWLPASDGVSAVVSAIFSVVVVVSSASALFAWGLPMLEHSKVSNAVENVYSQFTVLRDAMDSAVRQESHVVKQPVTFLIPQGTLTLSSQGDRLVLVACLQSGLPLTISGLDESDEGFSLDAGQALGTLEATVDWPEQGFSETLSSGPGPSYTFVCSRPLAGTVVVSLSDATEVPLGCVLVMDMGMAEFDCPSSVGSSVETFENGAVLLVQGTQETVRRSPDFSAQDDLLWMRILQLRCPTVGGGSGEIRLTLQLNATARSEYVVYALGLQVFGTHEDQWTSYYQGTLGLSLGGETMWYPIDTPPLRLIVARSLFTLT